MALCELDADLSFSLSAHSPSAITRSTAYGATPVMRMASAMSAISGCVAITWAIRFPRPNRIKFFALVKGSCWLCFGPPAEPVHVREGDVFLLTGERAFVLASDPAAVPVEAASLFPGSGARTVQIGDGSGCTQIGGRVRLAPSNDALLTDVLPPLIHIRATASRRRFCSGCLRGW